MRAVVPLFLGLALRGVAGTRSFQTEYLLGNITNLIFGRRGVVAVLAKVADDRPTSEALCSTRLHECLLPSDFPNAASAIAWMERMMLAKEEVFVRPESCDEQGHFYLIGEIGGLTKKLRKSVLHFYHSKPKVT